MIQQTYCFLIDLIVSCKPCHLRGLCLVFDFMILVLVLFTIELFFLGELGEEPASWLPQPTSIRIASVPSKCDVIFLYIFHLLFLDLYNNHYTLYNICI